MTSAAPLPRAGQGDASFSIYLFQEFAFDFMDFLTRCIDAKTGSHLLAHIPERLLSVVAALALGSILFVTVERPLTDFVRKRLSRRNTAGAFSTEVAAGSAHKMLEP
jgi:peptidoglycan/LPS O-acetylase OafA/YrhL